MTREEAIRTATERAKATNRSQVVWYNDADMCPDWSKRYAIKPFNWGIVTGDKSIRFVVSPDGSVNPITWA